MASGQHFKVLKGKRTDKPKIKDKKNYDQNYENIFRKNDKQKKETENGK